MGKILLGPGIDMQGSSQSSAGSNGLVPKPNTGDHVKFLRGDGSWANCLPVVSSSDNGKVLMVVDGNWTAGTIPSVVGVSF